MSLIDDYDLHLIHETVNEVNFTNKSKIHDYYSYSDLLKNAIEVRNQSVFSNVEIPHYDCFVPFQYQIDAVKLMLQKFEGRGVFGDQVGLGKTIESLMTIDVMFKMQEINHAVIVAPKNLIQQWKREIETKFPDTFYIVNDPDSITHSVKDLTLLEDSSRLSHELCNILFIDTELFSDVSSAEDDARTNALRVIYEREIAEKKNKIEFAKKEIEEIANRQGNRRTIEYNLAFGKSLEDAYMAISSIKEKKEMIGLLEESIAEKEKEIAGLNKALIFKKDVDLLVIDEAHNTVKSLNRSAHKDTFYSLKHKYCILMSATPIEKELDDVFELIQFVDPMRFPSKDRFHTYVGASGLPELVDNTRARTRLNGLLNSLFTRKRLKDKSVIDSLRSEHSLSEFVKFMAKDGEIFEDCFPEENKDALSDLVDSLNEHIFVMSKPIRRLRAEINSDFKEEQAFKIDELAGNKIFKPKLNSYIHKYYIDSHNELVRSFIDWAPPKRTSIFCDVRDSHCLNVRHTKTLEDILGELEGNIDYQISKILMYFSNQSARLEAAKRFHEKYPERVVVCDLPHPFMGHKPDYHFQFVKNVKELLPFTNATKEECDALINNIMSEFRKAPYDFDNEQSIDAATKAHMVYRDFCINKFHEDTPENYNTIFLIDYKRLEGADLHIASQMIFAQTTTLPVADVDIDCNGVKLNNPPISPLKLEQFLGRIYRIGQSNTSNIRMYFTDDISKYLFEEIYDDKEGLDMFGDGRNEIGYIIPTIEEIWRKNLKTLKNVNHRNVDKMSFIAIFIYLYTNQRPLLERFKESIRQCCKNLSVDSERF